MSEHRNCERVSGTADHLGFPQNDFTLQLHILLHQISVHQSTIASLPPLLSALEDTLVSTRTLAKTGFPHLQRLHNMLFAYGSSCIEVVWRKEVHSLLLRDSGSLAENLAHRLGKELHRREIFEANILGLLPWTIDVLGSKADKPSLQISTRGGADQLSDWTITIEDVKGKSACEFTTRVLLTRYSVQVSSSS